jgi:hypothetical protein
MRIIYNFASLDILKSVLKKCTYLFPNILFADPRPQVHNLELCSLQYAILCELHVWLSVVALYTDVSQIPAVRFSYYLCTWADTSLTVSMECI